MMKMNEDQSQEVQEIVAHCCNWDEGNCLLLGFQCPQQLSLTRINCIYFREAVLPGFPELYGEIKAWNNKEETK